jgi:hypothetical protein
VEIDSLFFDPHTPLLIAGAGFEISLVFGIVLAPNESAVIYT